MEIAPPHPETTHTHTGPPPPSAYMVSEKKKNHPWGRVTWGGRTVVGWPTRSGTHPLFLILHQNLLQSHFLAGLAMLGLKHLPGETGGEEKGGTPEREKEREGAQRIVPAGPTLPLPHRRRRRTRNEGAKREPGEGSRIPKSRSAPTPTPGSKTSTPFLPFGSPSQAFPPRGPTLPATRLHSIGSTLLGPA